MSLDVHNRVGNQPKVQTADLNLGFVAGLECAQHVALMRGILMENIDILSHQTSGVKLGQNLAEFTLVALHHFSHGGIHVQDVEIRVGDHHVGRAIVQGVLDAQIGARRSRGVLQRLLHLVHSGADAGLLPWQAVHGDIEPAF